MRVVGGGAEEPTVERLMLGIGAVHSSVRLLDIDALGGSNVIDTVAFGQHDTQRERMATRDDMARAVAEENAGAVLPQGHHGADEQFQVVALIEVALMQKGGEVVIDAAKRVLVECFNGLDPNSSRLCNVFDDLAIVDW